MCSVTASNAKQPGLDSRCPHNRWDWWLRPVTLLLGDKDIGMELVPTHSITLLSLKWLAALVFEAPDHMELWHCTVVGWYKAQDPINTTI